MTSDESIKLAPGIVIKNSYYITKRLGEGSFGEIYAALYKKDGLSKEVALKFGTTKPQKILLTSEINTLKSVQGKPHFAKFYGYGSFENYKFVAMELLGPSLIDLINIHQPYRFSLQTVIKIGIQALETLRIIHKAGFVHRDIKPGNFLVGRTHDTQGQIYLIDFGLCKAINYVDGIPSPPKGAGAFRGTLRYATLNSHYGKELGMADDIFSLLYMLIELYRGRLPWTSLTDKAKVQELKEKYLGRNLVAHLPPQFDEYRSYLLTLDYTKVPDYDYLISLLKDAAEVAKVDINAPFDWQDRRESMGSIGSSLSQSFNGLCSTHSSSRASFAATTVVAGEGKKLEIGCNNPVTPTIIVPTSVTAAELSHICSHHSSFSVSNSPVNSKPSMNNTVHSSSYNSLPLTYTTGSVDASRKAIKIVSVIKPEEQNHSNVYASPFNTVSLNIAGNTPSLHTSHSSSYSLHITGGNDSVSTVPLPGSQSSRDPISLNHSISLNNTSSIHPSLHTNCCTVSRPSPAAISPSSSLLSSTASTRSGISLTSFSSQQELKSPSLYQNHLRRMSDLSSSSITLNGSDSISNQYSSNSNLSSTSSFYAFPLSASSQQSLASLGCLSQHGSYTNLSVMNAASSNSSILSNATRGSLPVPQQNSSCSGVPVTQSPQYFLPSPQNSMINCEKDGCSNSQACIQTSKQEQPLQVMNNNINYHPQTYVQCYPIPQQLPQQTYNQTSIPNYSTTTPAAVFHSQLIPVIQNSMQTSNDTQINNNSSFDLSSQQKPLDNICEKTGQTTS